MRRHKKQSNRTIQEQALRQALLALSQKDVVHLEEQLLQDTALSQQVDALYARHQAKVEAGIRRRLGARRATMWRAVAVAASLALILLGSLQLLRPRQDLVAQNQPSGGLRSATPGVEALYSLAPSATLPALTPEPTLVPLPSESAAIMMVVVSPTPDPETMGTLPPNLMPSTSPSPSPDPTQIPVSPTPVPESLPPLWPGRYLPQLPLGYTLASVQAGDGYYQASYLGQDGQAITFTEYQKATIPAIIGKEYSYHALANGVLALWVQDGEHSTLLWDSDGHSFSLQAADRLEMLMRIANSLNQMQDPNRNN